MLLEHEIRLNFDDVLIRPKRSTLTSRSDVDIERDLKFRNGGWFKGVPILAANMDTVGTIEMNKALASHNMGTCLHKHYDLDTLAKHYATMGDHIYFKTFYSMGMSENDLLKFTTFVEENQGALHNGMKICIDVANGYQEKFVDYVSKIRDYVEAGGMDHSVIMAGNVVTEEMTEALILAGADIVKVGIGPGSVCTTRTKTGVGYPQLSAIIGCADAAHGLGGHVCADGGCRIPGDIAKAFGAGADFVMLGGMLAGHDECDGEIILKETGHSIPTPYRDIVYQFIQDGSGTVPPEYYKHLEMMFYGMSSDTAMDIHSGGVAKYRASEGKTVLVPYKGPVNNTVLEILGGVRSMMTYIGAKTLKEVPKRTTFVRTQTQKNDVYGRD